MRLFVICASSKSFFFSYIHFTINFRFIKTKRKNNQRYMEEKKIRYKKSWKRWRFLVASITQDYFFRYETYLFFMLFELCIYDIFPSFRWFFFPCNLFYALFLIIIWDEKKINIILNCAQKSRVKNILFISFCVNFVKAIESFFNLSFSIFTEFL